MSAPTTSGRAGPGVLAATLLLAVAGCAAQDPSTAAAGPSTSSATSGPAPDTSSTTAPPTTASAPPATSAAVVRFTSERTSVDVTIGEDTPATRDFLSMLPLELTVEEFAGAEKIAYLPRKLAHDGTAGSDPEGGHLIYYTPWGNLGFYYDADGIGFSDATLHLGTYRATPEQLALLERDRVAVDVVP